MRAIRRARLRKCISSPRYRRPRRIPYLADEHFTADVSSAIDFHSLLVRQCPQRDGFSAAPLKARSCYRESLLRDNGAPDDEFHGRGAHVQIRQPVPPSARCTRTQHIKPRGNPQVTSGGSRRLAGILYDRLAFEVKLLSGPVLNSATTFDGSARKGFGLQIVRYASHASNAMMCIIANRGWFVESHRARALAVLIVPSWTSAMIVFLLTALPDWGNI